MSTTFQFILAAALLTLATLALLLRPLWRAAKKTNENDRQQILRDIFRDQLQELERNRDDRLLSAEDFEQAKRELQRRLLEEIDAPSAAAAKGRPSRGSALALAVLIPFAAAFLYLELGNPQGLDARPVTSHQQAQELDAMLARLVERLKANPGDAKGWVILARSYKALGRFDEAAAAFSKASALVDTEASLLADYAETLAQLNGGQFNDKADALIARALKLDPNDAQTLFLAGASANDRRDFAAAVNYWERLLPQLDAGSEDVESLQAAIDKARAAAGQQPGKAARKVPPAKEAAAGKAIAGEVVLSGKLAAKARPEDTLYIFARPAEGSRMPLAVVRGRVADLPMNFRLDDSNSLPGGLTLSSAKTVVLEARVTRGGLAQRASGDLFGTLASVRPGSQKLRLVIDQVEP